LAAPPPRSGTDCLDAWRRSSICLPRARLRTIREGARALLGSSGELRSQEVGLMDAVVTTVPENDLRVTRTEAIPRWSMTSRLVLGAWTFSMPLAALSVALYALVVAPEVPAAVFAGVYYLITCHFILTLMYLAFAAQNPRLENKVGWMMALVLAGPVAILVYWVMHVWHAPKVGQDDVDSVIPQHRVRPAHAVHPLGGHAHAH
jgi:hypothetical protein